MRPPRPNKMISGVRGGLLVALLSQSFVFSLAQGAPVEKLSGRTWVTRESSLRVEPYDWSEPIALLETGLSVDVLLYSTNKKWVRIQSPSGREGWVPLKNTALVGRRSEPMIPRNPADAASLPSANTSVPRQPASVNEGTGAPLTELGFPEEPRPFEEFAPPQEVAPARSQRRLPVKSTKSKEIEFTSPETRETHVGISLGYDQFLNRESMPGLEFGGAFYRRFTSELLLGGGLLWARHAKSATDASPAVRARVSRTATNLAPFLALRLMKNIFSLDFTLGLDFQQSHLTTLDLDTGSILTTNPAGEKVTGSEWTRGLRVALAPTVYWPLDESSLLGLSLSYSMRKEFSSGLGLYAGTPTSSVQHSLGLGLRALLEF